MDKQVSELAQQLLELAKKHNLKIMTVESMTGGDIINSLTNIAGYSDYIYGGQIVYNSLAKAELLNLDISQNIYSEDFSRQMCISNYYCNADIIISVTGNACPKTGDKFGTFYYAVLYKNNNSNINKIWSQTVTLDLEPIKDSIKENNVYAIRTYIKTCATKEILNYAYKIIYNSII